MDSDFAYFLGVMAGDGYVSPGGLIDIKSDNREFLVVYSKIVKNIIDKEPKIRHETCKKSSYYRAHFYSKEFANTLKSFGLQSPKTFTVSMPIVIKQGELKYKLDFIRGVFDTDGCIYTRVDKKVLNYPNLTLSSRSENLVDDVYKVLYKLGFNAKITRFIDKNKPRYMLRMYGFEELYKYMEAIGFYNPPKLEKANKVLKNGIIRGS